MIFDPEVGSPNFVENSFYFFTFFATHFESQVVFKANVCRLGTRFRWQTPPQKTNKKKTSLVGSAIVYIHAKYPYEGGACISNS